MAERHFYRFDIQSELGKKFKLLWNDCTDAEKSADTWAAKVGAKTFYNSANAFAGGVDCVSFEEKPNEKIWESLGKDGDGIEQWKPRCSQRGGVLMLPQRNFKPSDTAIRIYTKRVFTFAEIRHMKMLAEWVVIAGVKPTGDRDKDSAAVHEVLKNEIFVRYVELYREDFEKVKDKQHKRKMTHVQRTAIELERSRLRLPIVSVRRIYNLLEADINDALKDKKRVVIDNTPTFFKTGRRFYVGSQFACKHHNLEEIDASEYRLKEDEVKEKYGEKKEAE